MQKSISFKVYRTSEVTNSVKIQELRAKIARIIADKLGVNMGFDL